MKIVNNINKPNVKKMAEVMIGEVFRFYSDENFLSDEVFIITDEHAIVRLNDGTLYIDADWYDHRNEDVVVLDAELVIKGEK